MLLWLTDKKGYAPGIRAVVVSALSRQGVKASSIIFNSLHFKAPLLADANPKKALDKYATAQALKVLDNEIAQLKPTLIVCNDEATLRAITGKRYSLGTIRGSLYYYKNVPVIVIDGFNSIRFHVYGKFIFELDLAKIARWATGKQQNEPPFDYRLCKTVDEVAHHATAAENATMVSSDTETSNGFITCITYTYDDRSGKLISFVVPFFDPFCENGAYWPSENDEVRVRKILRKLNASPVVKAFANGTYDSAYEIKEGMPCANYLVDTQNLMHCMWVEAPKKLHNVASYFCDYYTYWKDESKGIKEDGWGKDHSGIERYWRYCALDGYYTYLGSVALVGKITKLKWALRNYSVEFPLSVGPCLAASLRGIKVDRQRHAKIMREQQILAGQGREDLRRLSGEPDYNINAPNDNAWLLYDVLGAKKTRIQRMGSKLGLRSTDEKVLRLMKEQRNFFVSNAIDRILKAKKPAAVLSKYGDYNAFVYRNDRFLSWHNAAATETFRLNSGNSQFWHGTNIMNLQPAIQEMFIADDNYVLLDIDYSASDDWFIAYEAEDEKKMEVLKTKDTHSFHAATFFKLDYDKVVAGKKKHEEWVVHAITGVRQIAKKFNHGKNFRMGAQMTYNLMGRNMAVATAKLIGYKNPEKMDDKELIGMCQEIGDMYDDRKRGLYKRIKPWQDEIVEELKANTNLVTSSFGMTRNFFGSANDHGTQRELSAFYGQAGTSGNMNRALNKIFYSHIDDGVNCLFLAQVHDSFLFLLHKDKMNEKILQIKNIMEEEIEVNGRKFFVPTQAEVGFTWGKNMLPWNNKIIYSDIIEHENKAYATKFVKGEKALLQELENINFASVENEEIEEELNYAK